MRGAVSKPAWRRRVPSTPPAARGPLVDGTLLLFPGGERAFWSERWIDVGSLLALIADRLRPPRPFRYIELDGGWGGDPGLPLVDRLWCRVDIRALVEAHGGGTCLCRVRTRSRVAPLAIPPVLGIASVMLLYGAGVVASPLGTSAIVGLLSTAIVLGEMLTM